MVATPASYITRKRRVSEPDYQKSRYQNRNGETEKKNEESREKNTRTRNENEIQPLTHDETLNN
jgi:hypothetical protein